MKILVLDAYFEPENTSFTHLERDLIDELVNQGNEITVVCPVPTRGIDEQTAKRYLRIKDESLYDGKVRVKRFWAFRERRGVLSRALRYFWCNRQTYRVARKFGDVDLIFCNSTPPIQALAARRIKKKLNKPFVYNLQDVFPDSLVNAGLARKNSLIWKIGRKIENKTYAAADKIIVISEDFKKNIIDKGVSEDKIEVVYNWVNAESVKPVKRAENALFDECGISREYFVAVYAGNFGKAQGVSVILEAAGLLKEHSDIKFVLFGGGAEYEEVRSRAENLSNVTVNPLLPSDRISEVYSMGDVNLITCKKGFGSCGFPSKTWSIMACNSYIVASYDKNSELAEIIEKYNVGQVVEPENAKALADAILSLKGKDNSTNARDILLRIAEKQVCVEKYSKIIAAAIEDNR